MNPRRNQHRRKPAPGAGSEKTGMTGSESNLLPFFGLKVVFFGESLDFEN
jgi:hypothetical protein